MSPAKSAKAMCPFQSSLRILARTTRHSVRRAAAAGAFLSCMCLFACESIPAVDPAQITPQTHDSRGLPIPQQGWVWAKGDGHHSSVVFVVGDAGGKLVAQAIVTPPGRPRDYLHGFVVPLSDVESDGKRISFRLKPVDAAIRPFRTTLQFSTPPSGQTAIAKMSVDPRDATLVGAKPEQLAKTSVDLEFRAEPWPLAPAYEEAMAMEHAQQAEAAATATKQWKGTCDSGTTIGPSEFDPKKCHVELGTRGGKLVSCQVVENRAVSAGGPRVLFELIELTGTLDEGSGRAIVNGVRHPYYVKSDADGEGGRVRIGDACAGAHQPADTPYFSATVGLQRTAGK